MKYRRTFGVWLVSTIVIMLFAFWLGEATAQEKQVPVFKCEGYGRMLECKAGKAFENRAMMWSIAKTEGEKPLKDNPAYRSAGDSLAYQLRDNSSYTVELHFIDWQNDQIYRQTVKWGKDPKDKVWKVLFVNPPAESEASKTSPSTVKQAAKEK